MGTPSYMSPEQCRGRDVDHRTDIYALGVILYEMFAGRLPFSGGFAELITHHLMTVPKPPSSFAPVPPALDRLILACLDKDIDKRPQTAEELGRALDAALPTEAAAGGASAAPAAAVTPVTQPDTLAPAPGRTSPDLTQLPARDCRPMLIGLGVAAVLVVGGLALLTGGHRGGAVSVPPAELGPPPQAAAPPPPSGPPAGRVHVVVTGVDSASVMVDGKLVAAGVHEARVPNVTPGEPHHLRVEASGRAPFERTFTVAADAEVELEAALAAPPVAETHAAKRAAGEPKHQRVSPPSPAPGPSAPKPRHRDGLVGDDIFDAPRAH